MFTFSLQAPYILYVEVVEVEDLATSPVVSKSMNTLRHTKSEENLAAALTSYSHLELDAESDCWSQDDDEISQQVDIFCFYLFYTPIKSSI